MRISEQVTLQDASKQISFFFVISIILGCIRVFQQGPPLCLFPWIGQEGCSEEYAHSFDTVPSVDKACYEDIVVHPR